MIEAVRGKGANRASVRCDSCDRSETVPCGYQRTTTTQSEPIAGQVVSKITASGWSVVKGKHYCPTCEAKRKAQHHEAKMAVKETQEAATPRTMTPRQKREIIGMLELVYDDDGKRFKQGESDRTVADAIGGGCLWGWVAQVRDELFGPDTRNQEVEALRVELKRLEGEIRKQEKETLILLEQVNSAKARIEAVMA